jgi:hypothetical protein
MEAAANAALEAAERAKTAAEHAKTAATQAAKAAQLARATAREGHARANLDIEEAELAETGARDRFHEAQSKGFGKDSD